MHDSFRSDLLHLCRCAVVFLLAGLFAAGAAAVFWADVRNDGNVVENGAVEHAQLALLAATAAVYALRSRRHPDGPALLACSLFTVCMAVRELDGVFDKNLFHGAWTLVEIVPLALFAAATLPRFRRFVAAAARFAATPEFALFAAAVALLLFFSRIVGMKRIWNLVFDLPIWRDASAPYLLPDGTLPGAIDIPRHVKNLVEEGFELCCYVLLFFSSVLPPLLRRRRCGSGDVVV